MKIGIFAASDVGLQIVSLFSENKKEITCLIMDCKDKDNLNNQIQKTAACKNIFTSEDLTKPSTLKTLESLKVDLIVLAWWPYIIKKPLLNLPQLGFLNTHPSLLPYNRGRHYYFWNILDEDPFGVTLHWIDKDIDTGDIAFQSKLEKTWEDTGFSLRERSKQAMVSLFKEKFDRIVSGNIPRIKQDLKKGSFHLGNEIESSSEIFLDKNYSGKELLNLIRGRSGFPHGGAWFRLGEFRYKVTSSIKKVTNE
jgi:methionyl-tRNA formyltransferase